MLAVLVNPGVTFSIVEPLTEFRLAVIVVAPAPAPAASPALVMEATLGTDELQMTAVVRFCVLLSE